MAKYHFNQGFWAAPDDSEKLPNTFALNRILPSLQEEQINVEYLYAFTGSAAYSAYVVLRVDDAAHAELVLKNAGISTLSDPELMQLL